MRYASRVGSPKERTRSAWDIHYAALDMVARGEDVLILTIGDTDFPTPANVVSAAHDSLLRGRTHYTPSAGHLALRQAIAQRYLLASRQKVSADQVVATIGAQNALLTAALCLVENGDEVIVPEPMYSTYSGTIASAGAKAVTVRCAGDNGFHPVADEIEAAITPRTRAIFLATPNNPTGAVYTAEELGRIGDICRKHDLWLVSDEVYADLVYDRRHVSAGTLQHMAERVIVIGSLSKSHAMAGWRLGWMIGPVEFARRAARVTLYVTYGVPTFIQDAAVVALETMPFGITEMKDAYANRRKQLCGRLGHVGGLSCRLPEGGMFVMLDVRQTGLSSYDFATRLLDEERVAALPADDFGPSAAGYLRLNLGTPDEKLIDAADRIARFTERVTAPR